MEAGKQSRAEDRANNSPPSRSKQSTPIKRRAVVVLLAIVVAVGGSEAILRAFGYWPYKAPAYRGLTDEEIIKRSVYVPHAKYGYVRKPGAHVFDTRTGYEYRMTIQQNGFRITRPDEQSSGGANRPQLWVMGCSFTLGGFLNDEESFPWLLQEAMPQFEVRNYGMGGWGTTHEYLLLKDLLERGERPQVVAVTYATRFKTAASQ